MIGYQITRTPLKVIGPQRRYLWQYVCMAFNKVDYHRLKEVGPDRMCTEWVLKNGGAVRFLDNPSVLHKNYNSLPPEGRKISVSEIDATQSTIMSIGFEHLKDCKHIQKVILDSCKYLEDEAVAKLGYIDQSLKELKIDRCRNVTSEGLLEMVKSVPHLKRLELGRDMPLVKDVETRIVPEIKKILPECEITVK